MLKQWFTALLDLVYPPKCPVCRTGVAAHGTWCLACLSKIVARREINLAEHHVKYLDCCWVLCDYSGGVKKLIRDMKFRGVDKYGPHFSWLLKHYLEPGRLGSPDMVIPVPLHAARLKERGFNQAERMFKPWAMEQGWVWSDDCLVRKRATAPQWQLELTERRKNMKDAFLITRPEAVQGKNILLVDDIFTSGVTMDECAKVLKKAGAKRVTGLTLASGAQ